LASPDGAAAGKRNVVGREGTIAELDRFLTTALQGKRQVVFVTGEAAIGKTTLVDVFHHYAAGRANLRIARGQCVEGFGGKEAYYPVLEALGQLTRDGDSSPIVQNLAKRAPTWLIQFPALVKAEQQVLKFLKPLKFQWQLGRVHATAWDFYRSANNQEASRQHLEHAATYVWRIADSFPTR
jgi:predicted ATPase